MSGSNVVYVKGIAPSTTEQEVRDFFSFWYVDRYDTFFVSKISSIKGRKRN
jgi:hypothetical protein